MRALLIGSVGLVLITIILQSGCSNPADSGTKDPNSYSWAADTISYRSAGQTWMQDIYGASAKDIYMVGHCSWFGDGSL